MLTPVDGWRTRKPNIREAKGALTGAPFSCLIGAFLQRSRMGAELLFETTAAMIAKSKMGTTKSPVRAALPAREV